MEKNIRWEKFGRQETMRIEKLEEIINETERFLKKAQDLKRDMEENNREIKDAEKKTDEENKTIYVWKRHFPKECGSVRRSSLDLTRALAEFRRY